MLIMFVVWKLIKCMKFVWFEDMDLVMDVYMVDEEKFVVNKIWW